MSEQVITAQKRIVNVESQGQGLSTQDLILIACCWRPAPC